jgi:hypothetical protein
MAIFATFLVPSRPLARFKERPLDFLVFLAPGIATSSSGYWKNPIHPKIILV